MKFSDRTLLIGMLAAPCWSAAELRVRPCLLLWSWRGRLRICGRHEKATRFIWHGTVPAQTTDRQSVRHPGPTRICRSLGTKIDDCKPPVAEIAASQFPVPAFKKSESKRGAPAPKIQPLMSIRYLVSCRRKIPRELTYAVFGVERKWGERRTI